MDPFHPSTRSWFAEHFERPTPVQERGWAAIASGAHSLLAAPTGSGKTLAAFLWAIDRAVHEDATGVAPGGTRIVYVSPLKALVADVERNLRAPLAGVLRAAERLGLPARPLRVDLRTGDTPQAERRRQAKDPGDVLVTTPESLFLILGSAARAGLASVTTVIVDEIHALAPSKRGAHLALSLERLAELCPRDPQRIGLSATAHPLEEVGRFLAGARPFEVVDAGERPRLALEIRVPVPDMDHPPAPQPRERRAGGPVPDELYAYQMGAPTEEHGLWPSIWAELVRAIRAHRSTILFVNSRGLAERLTQRLNQVADEELALAHHGSVSHAQRAEIEDALKRGAVRAIVATSSLELGIDMGAVDLVVLVESPGSVARGLQRVGRAGHSVGAASRGWIFPKFKGDLVECAVIAEGMLAGAIEAVAVPVNPLDVLAQQLVAACCDRPRSLEELATLVRRARPFADLPDEALRATLDMLTGRFPSAELAELRPRLSWDRSSDLLSARRGAAMVTRLNAGTIPDRGAFAVHVGEGGPRIGELDEEMVHESRAGDTFLLGASSWRVEAITRDRVIVSPAPGEPGRLPFWKGEGPGRPVELGRALGAYLREVAAGTREEALARVLRGPLDEQAAANLVEHVLEQREASAVPTDRTLVVERFRDELGDWRVCLLSPFGSRVHAPWALAIEERLGRRGELATQILHHDDGIVLRIPDGEPLPSLEELLPDPEELEELVTRRVAGSALFAALFRENAVRALLIPRRRPEQRSPLWAQRIKARGLLATVERFPDFPIVLETYRQALSDVFDLDALRALLGGLRSREIDVVEVETRSPSPFARGLAFAFVASYLYDSDAPLAERRAQSLALDRGLLRELLGRAELRELLDPEALAEVEAELACLVPERAARDRDELSDLLRRLGDLTDAQVVERCAGADPAAWLAELERERRATRVTIAGERRWIAAEEAWLYRDVLGCAPDPGLPAELLAPRAEPGDASALAALVRRHARTHGPFHARDVARRYGEETARVEPILRALERAEELVLGELRPGGSEAEWCDAEVLRRIKRRTLGRLRGRIAAVDEPTFARFLPRWHRVGAPDGASARLEDALEQIEGLALPWSALVADVLPARVRGFAAEDLDALGASGRFVWVGRGARGPRDGSVALYRRERAAALLEPPVDDGATSSLHAAIFEHLASRGASFLTEIELALRRDGVDGTTRELEQAVWDLAWAGRITNDTFQPLRALAGARTRGSPRTRRSASPTGGRWWRVEELLLERPSETERSLARAENLLARYGVVSREAASAEGVAGGFAALYRVLGEMEERGRIRRGWFVEGLSGAQFALAGALDRMRSLVEGEDAAPLVLSAVDPANPWGALLPWPSADEAARGRLRRVAGAHVVLVAGRLRVYVPQGRRELVTFGDDDDGLRAALASVVAIPRHGRRLAAVERVDGVRTEDSPLRATLEAAGFVRDFRGYLPDPTRRR